MISSRLTFLLAALLLQCSQVAAFVSGSGRQGAFRQAAASTKLYDKPFAVIVQATIEPDRMAEFLEMIQTNAEATRKEPGCLRFDVLRSQESPNEFFFYELYKNEQAIDYHKEQPHYNLWAEFKSSGGTIASTSYKTDAEFLT
uniref:ABM domain-containing protein n=1 Tax=Entomoneis paludosa TaxID=265537 RepID=A0A7S3DVV9_9STRA|mmetsp:Transcript_40368/g.84023  ORF Transcript_40368/g.84023 Transcript_40368/m.84023 type:complete len:143 (+) Transcript_40368:76-504(+)|eukprot:CAMPEP_0172459576 /NCGR_PEP_ID=MMETSP1065-20121228/33255_1 /TAXON_ID=265537 /ORGANISM="Amphiprora paludosa, Strain CCMP125" /LENGTH=142 /DNA_ID=CAMNT_0013214313 /DNA_START=44 /DNA_END=472 /DNA_ORIENTATION=+